MMCTQSLGQHCLSVARATLASQKSLAERAKREIPDGASREPFPELVGAQFEVVDFVGHRWFPLAVRSRRARVRRHSIEGEAGARAYPWGRFPPQSGDAGRPAGRPGVSFINH